jgi:tetratricopeptide (TPR) repeat protein
LDLRFTLRRYEQETHSSIPLRGVQDGLLSIFEGWEVEEPFALYELGGLAAIDKHFAVLSERLGWPVTVPQAALLGPFYELEGGKRFAEAEQVIKRVIESFPDSPAALYYAGRLYLQMGNRPLAIEMLRRSLVLSPNYPASRSLLTFMEVDPDELVQEAR